MGFEIDIREVSGCICRRARRTTRQITQVYDRALEPSGLTANQFDLLTNLFGAALADKNGLPIGVLAARMGMHPTTLNRDLKPLLAKRFVGDGRDTRDRRIRAVRITARGREKLRKAVPFWRMAQTQVEGVLGLKASRRLNALLDLTSAKLSA